MLKLCIAILYWPIQNMRINFKSIQEKKEKLILSKKETFFILIVKSSEFCLYLFLLLLLKPFIFHKKMTNYIKNKSKLKFDIINRA